MLQMGSYLLMEIAVTLDSEQLPATLVLHAYLFQEAVFTKAAVWKEMAVLLLVRVPVQILNPIATFEEARLNVHRRVKECGAKVV